jgi:predicted Holliday junction resolvase-like endonuclease
MNLDYDFIQYFLFFFIILIMMLLICVLISTLKEIRKSKIASHQMQNEIYKQIQDQEVITQKAQKAHQTQSKITNELLKTLVGILQIIK